MKNIKLYLFALVALVTILGSIWLVQQRDMATSADIPLISDDMQESFATDLTSITWQQGSSAVSIAKEGDDWLIAELDNYPADLAVLRSKLSPFLTSSLLEAKTQDAKLFDQLGIDLDNSPQITFSLATADDYQIVVGERMHKLGATYVYQGEQVWLASGDLAIDVGRPQDWADKQLVTIAANRVAEIVFTAPDSVVHLLRQVPDASEATSAAVTNSQQVFVSKADASVVAEGAALVAALADLRFSEMQRQTESATLSGYITKVVLA